MAMDKDDGELLVDRVNNFLSAHKKAILVFIAVIVISVTSLAVYFSFTNKKKNEEIAAVEKIIFDLNKEKEEIEKKKKEAEDAKKKEEEEKKKAEEAEEGVEKANAESEKAESEEDVTDDEDEKEEPKDPEVLAKEDEAIPKLEELATTSSGYAKYLALYNVADIYFARKDYEKAKEYYLKALDPVPNTYVAGVLLFNIAVCIEELKGEDSEALEYYQKSYDIEDFPLKPRSLFNVARLQEKMGRENDALATYNSIIEKYPDSDFAMIGKSRIITLEIKNEK